MRLRGEVAIMEEQRIVKVALDAMGGDNAPGQIVEGALRAVNQEERLHVIFVGRKTTSRTLWQGKTIPETG